MADSLQGDLSTALATRLNLQISLSSLPVVEEWMDPKMDRWLEAVPMPTELPTGENAEFLVGIASDLSRVRWAAFGHPAGFVPKMADYLSSCAVSQSEVDIINTVGERYQPERVGTWIAVHAGKLFTGWLFVHALPLADMATISADVPALEQLAVWAGAGGVEHCQRFSRCLGDTPHVEMSVAVPGGAIAGRALSELGGHEVPDALSEALPEGELTLIARADASGFRRMSVLWADRDVTSAKAVAESLGVPWDDGMDRLQGALGASEVTWLEVSLGRDGAHVDLHFSPGSNPPKPRPN